MANKVLSQTQKIQMIINLLRPRDKTQVQSEAGMFPYLTMFIPNSVITSNHSETFVRGMWSLCGIEGWIKN